MIGAPRRHAIKTFSHLWKLDDSEWMEERKQIWREIQNTCFVKSEREDVDRYRNYFLTSKYASYIGIQTLYFLTPILSKGDSRLFLKSGVMEKRDYKTLVDNYFGSYVFDNSDGSPWIRKQAQRFYDHVIADFLARAPEAPPDPPVPDVKPASYSAEDFVLSYFAGTAGLFRGHDNYSAFTDLHPQFLHLLENSDALEQNLSDAEDYFGEVFDGCEIVVSEDSFSAEAKRHAAQLLEDRERILTIWNRVKSAGETSD